MKNYKIKFACNLLIAFFVCNIVYAQIDSSAESFFPIAVGNIWNYQYAPNYTHQTMLTRDSIGSDGSHLLFFDNATEPLYKIDSTLNVFQYPMRLSITSLLYKLTANLNDTWVVKDTSSERLSRKIARIDDIYWENVFGYITQIKKIGYYEQFSDTTDFNFWEQDIHLASGFGYLFSIYDASQDADALIGCVINGNKYGTVLSVKNSQRNFLSSFALNPAYPNPFNPSTTLSYQLPEKKFVNLKVFDMFGREIALLVNEEQEAGYHQTKFTPRNLSSGVYFVRMTAENFSQITKIIYLK